MDGWECIHPASHPSILPPTHFLAPLYPSLRVAGLPVPAVSVRRRRKCFWKSDVFAGTSVTRTRWRFRTIMATCWHEVQHKSDTGENTAARRCCGWHCCPLPNPEHFSARHVLLVSALASLNHAASDNWQLNLSMIKNASLPTSSNPICVSAFRTFRRRVSHSIDNYTISVSNCVSSPSQKHTNHYKTFKKKKRKISDSFGAERQAE